MNLYQSFDFCRKKQPFLLTFIIIYDTMITEKIVRGKAINNMKVRFTYDGLLISHECIAEIVSADYNKFLGAITFVPLDNKLRAFSIEVSSAQRDMIMDDLAVTGYTDIRPYGKATFEMP